MKFIAKWEERIVKKLYVIIAVVALLMTLPAVLFADSEDEDAIITTIAGPSVEFEDFDGDRLVEDLRPAGLALDSKTGDLYITSLQKHRVLKRDADTGMITLVAGTGVSGFAGDGDRADLAKLNIPRALAFNDGILFVADRSNNRVRVVNTTDKEIHVLGIAIAPGHIDTIAGNGLRGWNGGEGSLPALSAALRPNGLAIDKKGNLFINLVGDRLLFLNLQDSPIPIPGQRKSRLGPGYIVSVAGTGVENDAGDGGPAHLASFLAVPNVDLDQEGTHVLYLADRDSHRIRVAILPVKLALVGGPPSPRSSRLSPPSPSIDPVTTPVPAIVVMIPVSPSTLRILGWNCPIDCESVMNMLP